MTVLGFLALRRRDARPATGSSGRGGSPRRSSARSSSEVLHRPIETLSKGFKRRVGLAQAILHDPPVLVLDEPTDGLDPNQKHEVRRLIRHMAEDKAIIISTHILEEVDAVCTRAVIIARGRVVADARPDELKRRSRYHNAVRLTVNANLLPKLRARDARDLPRRRGGARRSARSTASRRMLLVPHAGAGDRARRSARSCARAASRSTSWSIEQGRLDDVFRDLTMPTHSAH